MTDLFSKFDALIAQREGLLATGVKDPFSLVMEEVKSPTVAVVNGKETILLGTYNYMGMTFDDDVIAAGKKALDEFGAGTTGSRVLNGTFQGHKECEDALKEFYGMDHAMVFSTGYQANLGIISTIAGKGDYIILDIDSHASIYDGCKMGDAEIVAFRHNDVEALEKRLKRLPADAGKLVVLEGVYSMLGDIAPLREMVAVAKKHGAMVLVDEAYHDFVADPSYSSLVDMVKKGENVIISRTASKIHGLAGLRTAFVIARPDIIARLQPLSTSAPGVFGALGAAASIQDTAFQAMVKQRNIEGREIMKTAIAKMGRKMTESQTNFVFFHAGMPVEQVQKAMLAKGFMIGRAFPPYTDWVRISIGTPDEMRAVAAALPEVISGAPKSLGSSER